MLVLLSPSMVISVRSENKPKDETAIDRMFSGGSTGAFANATDGRGTLVVLTVAAQQFHPGLQVVHGRYLETLFALVQASQHFGFLSFMQQYRQTS